jgi:hypothetical protein
MRAIYPMMGTLRKVNIERSIASWRRHRARWKRPAARCSASDCSRPGARRGLCARHYDRWWKAKRRGAITAFGPLDPPARVFGRATTDEEVDEVCFWRGWQDYLKAKAPSASTVIPPRSRIP